jgi:hypothetical protein
MSYDIQKLTAKNLMRRHNEIFLAEIDYCKNQLYDFYISNMLYGDFNYNTLFKNSLRKYSEIVGKHFQALSNEKNIVMWNHILFTSLLLRPKCTFEYILANVYTHKSSKIARRECSITFCFWDDWKSVSHWLRIPSQVRKCKM